MKDYEIMFILSTQLTDEEKKANIELVETTLTKAGAVELKTEVLGEKKLAYPIKKKENGYYVLTLFQIDGTKLTEVEAKLNITETILKYMIVKND
ncbi:MAG: 30S ribosomal protein S6 [Leptotrichiaceae bacterium]|nr:30S ribosomal protein S6 [Leptotrichiaceae bacterium]MBP6280454.1 30S ribosomal protein S6 [Leptotrichiaceae bacterium]MBP7099953.1 30S ribosomal protein S6 [Leptotrichiaceae bacterium]MBP7725302.1 30S ribosomal protein S6 [Leptotrichiaceae bacterium]MBP9629078.1 30S ribosomal protein S6 [Leptotrichiaceae bacterium]